MSSLRHGAEWSRRPARGTKLLALGSAMLGLLLGGCRHQQVLPTLPAVLKAPDVQPPTPAPPTMETAPPTSISTAPPPVRVTEVKPKRRPKKAAVKPATEPVPAPSEVASVSPPQPLGELSAGGELNPKTQQEANDLIASTERRLAALAKTTATQQEAHTREVQRFLLQARQALGTGDLEGAKTLATKAKLLMDDLEKWSPQP